VNCRCVVSSVVLIVAAMASGCQTTQKLEVSQSGAPTFERFRAEYRFEQADRLLTRSFDSESDNVDQRDARQQNVDNASVRTVAAESSSSDARLKLECPHPNGDADLALLTLTSGERRGPSAVVRQDVRQLTVPRSQIELLISDLAQSGYFDQLPGETASAQLAVQIDRGKVDRSWKNDARLLDLAHQTLTRGTAAIR
jgi:hypothetical protein